MLLRSIEHFNIREMLNSSVAAAAAAANQQSTRVNEMKFSRLKLINIDQRNLSTFFNAVTHE